MLVLKNTKSESKRSAALIEAQKRYRESVKKKIAAGEVKPKRKLPGSDIPDDVLKVLESVQDEHKKTEKEDMSLSAAIWHCIRKFKRS